MSRPDTVSIQGLHDGACNVRRGANDVFWQEYSRGEWEPDTQAVFRRFLDPQHSFVDIGAWVGPTLLLGAPLARYAYGIEPDPIAFQELRANIDSNPELACKIELFNLCIAAETGKKAFGSRGDGGDSTSSLLFASEKTVWSVDGFNFAEWIERNAVCDCNFIKMDIEGGEYDVIPTMAAYLAKYRPTLHLSLHPDFAGERVPLGFVARCKRSLHRLRLTLRVLSVLRLYRYLYDPRGRVPSGIPTWKSRVRDLLARIEWPPAVLALTALYSMAGGNDTIVATDVRW